MQAGRCSPEPYPLAPSRDNLRRAGKPAFANGHPLWFNLSHSGDDIALLISDEGEVGCDIEVIRPRENWQALANAVFSLTEHDELEREAPEEQLSAFWRIWTRKEAIVKQRGGSAWQIVSIDSTAQSLPVSQLRFGSLSGGLYPYAFHLNGGSGYLLRCSCGIKTAMPVKTNVADVPFTLFSILF